MSFLRQIGTEFKNLFRVKFLLIFGILILAVSIGAPIVTALTSNSDDGYYSGPVVYEKSYAYSAVAVPYYDDSQQPVVVDGVTITADNPYYWNIRSLQEQQNNMDSSSFSTPGALDIALRVIDEQIDYYVHSAQYITTYEDYRMDIAWNGSQLLYDRFIYQNTDTTDPAELKEAMQSFMYMEPDAYDKKYVDITAEQRLAALDEVETNIQALYDVVENDNFPKYIDLSIQQKNDNIKDLEDQIEIQEQAIVENPDQEDSLNQIIEDLKKQIDLIQTNDIPILEYRLEKNIEPFADVWQNTALDDISNSRQQLAYNTIISEEDFNREQYMAIQYGSYARYVAAVQAQIDKLNNTILIAQKCLDADKPDMKYVTDGARSITTKFLIYSIAAALFGILVGGWLIASEFQSGTVRLLMIRPKTRLKILLSKFFAGLLLCLALYAAGIILNIVLNGICFGFSDFAFPNFTATGEVGFFAYYIPKFIACIVPIIFAYCVAFMFSVLVKNVAVSISVPIVCFVGCVVVMNFLAYRMMDWIAFTPIPYVQLSDFFRPASNYSLPAVQTMIQNGVPISLTYGIIMLLALAGVCLAASMLVFRKKDITQ